MTELWGGGGGRGGGWRVGRYLYRAAISLAISTTIYIWPRAAIHLEYTKNIIVNRLTGKEGRLFCIAILNYYGSI